MEHQSSDLRLKKTDIIFVIGFILGLAVLSFVFGVRIGKKTALSSLGDIEQMKISEKNFTEKSEEINDTSDIDNTTQIKSDKVKAVVKTIEPPKVIEKTVEPVVESKPVVIEKSLESKPSIVPYISSGQASYSRKRTILVGEFLSLDQAQIFAQAFKLRGYEVYIQKVSQKGIERLRVSLGRFQDQKEAKFFMQANSNMFLKNKYTITSFL